MPARTTENGPLNHPVLCAAAREELRRPQQCRQWASAAEALLREELRPGVASTEETLFKGMHACAALLEREGPQGPGGRTRPWQELHGRIADRLVHLNMGLVHTMRSRAGLLDADEDELSSAGLWSLFQAVLAFDPWRGFRFSTYACHAIIRGYRQIWKKTRRQRRHLRVLQETTAHRYDGDGPSSVETDYLRERVGSILKGNRAGLSSVERFVIERRFGTEAARGETLDSIGRMIRLSKERVRQIQAVALQKLREALERETQPRPQVLTAG